MLGDRNVIFSSLQKENEANRLQYTQKLAREHAEDELENAKKRNIQLEAALENANDNYQRLEEENQKMQKKNDGLVSKLVEIQLVLVGVGDLPNA